MALAGSNGHATSGNACTVQLDRQDKQRQSCDVGWFPSLLVYESDVRCAVAPLHVSGELHPGDPLKGIGADTMALLSE